LGTEQRRLACFRCTRARQGQRWALPPLVSAPGGSCCRAGLACNSCSKDQHPFRTPCWRKRTPPTRKRGCCRAGLAAAHAAACRTARRTWGKKRPASQKEPGSPSVSQDSMKAMRARKSCTQLDRGLSEGYATRAHSAGTCGRAGVYESVCACMCVGVCVCVHVCWCVCVCTCLCVVCVCVCVYLCLCMKPCSSLGQQKVGCPDSSSAAAVWPYSRLLGCMLQGSTTLKQHLIYNTQASKA